MDVLLLLDARQALLKTLFISCSLFSGTHACPQQRSKENGGPGEGSSWLPPFSLFRHKIVYNSRLEPRTDVVIAIISSSRLEPCGRLSPWGSTAVVLTPRVQGRPSAPSQHHQVSALSIGFWPSKHVVDGTGWYYSSSHWYSIFCLYSVVRLLLVKGNRRDVLHPLFLQPLAHEVMILGPDASPVLDLEDLRAGAHHQQQRAPIVIVRIN